LQKYDHYRHGRREYRKFLGGGGEKKIELRREEQTKKTSYLEKIVDLTRKSGGRPSFSIQFPRLGYRDKGNRTKERKTASGRGNRDARAESLSLG